MYDGISGDGGPGEIETPAPQDQIAKIVDDARPRVDDGLTPIASTEKPRESGENFWLLVIGVATVAALAFIYTR